MAVGCRLSRRKVRRIGLTPSNTTCVPADTTSTKLSAACTSVLPCMPATSSSTAPSTSFIWPIFTSSCALISSRRSRRMLLSFLTFSFSYAMRALSTSVSHSFLKTFVAFSSSLTLSLMSSTSACNFLTAPTTSSTSCACLLMSASVCFCCTISFSLATIALFIPSTSGPSVDILLRYVACSAALRVARRSCISWSNGTSASLSSSFFCLMSCVSNSLAAFFCLSTSCSLSASSCTRSSSSASSFSRLPRLVTSPSCSMAFCLCASLASSSSCSASATSLAFSARVCSAFFFFCRAMSLLLSASIITTVVSDMASCSCPR
eukprot:comp10261_c0_seq1/m.5067 comp10261_c0_seq1/g.5067  ORF comp10261_c0_seq1/g.5067 comp10261_c0_seq1/m.5067 type:complete len:320 (+) comp10261_c0_seq1:299-1258(+)